MTSIQTQLYFQKPVIESIFEASRLEDIDSFRLVCKVFRDGFDNNDLWQKFGEECGIERTLEDYGIASGEVIEPGFLRKRTTAYLLWINRKAVDQFGMSNNGLLMGEYKGFIHKIHQKCSDVWESQFRKDTCNTPTFCDSYVPLLKIPPRIRNLPNLELLALHCCSLVKIPSHLESYSTLTTIGFSSNHIYSITPSIEQACSLRKLDLAGNRIVRCTASLSKLTNLQELVLSHNLLRKLDPELTSATTLKQLMLNKNPLCSLSEDIARLVQLTRLDLSKCRLTSLPAEIGSLTDLRSLALRKNSLSTFPESFFELTKLTELDISRNKFTEISPLMGHLSCLNKLDISDNLIQTISMLSSLRSLAVLTITGIFELLKEARHLTQLVRVIAKPESRVSS